MNKTTTENVYLIKKKTLNINVLVKGNSNKTQKRNKKRLDFSNVA